MKPAIVEREAFRLVGMKYQGKNENHECAMLWAEFMPRLPEIRNRGQEHVSYGFEVFTEESKQTGEFVYIAAVEVSDFDDVPAGMVSQVVPASKYAVFSIPAVIEDIPKAICDIYERWLPESGLEPSGDWDFEYYDQDFVPNSVDSRLLFYVPVK